MGGLEGLLDSDYILYFDLKDLSVYICEREVFGRCCILDCFIPDLGYFGPSSVGPYDPPSALAAAALAALASALALGGCSGGHHLELLLRGFACCAGPKPSSFGRCQGV